jgi:hypothetical protein
LWSQEFIQNPYENESDSLCIRPTEIAFDGETNLYLIGQNQKSPFQMEFPDMYYQRKGVNYLKDSKKEEYRASHKDRLYICRIDTNGNKNWVKTIVTRNDSYGIYFVATGKGKDIFISYTFRNDDSEKNIGFIKYDMNGKPIWLKWEYRPTLSKSRLSSRFSLLFYLVLITTMVVQMIRFIVDYLHKHKRDKG